MEKVDLHVGGSGEKLLTTHLSLRVAVWQIHMPVVHHAARKPTAVGVSPGGALARPELVCFLDVYV